MHENYGRRYKAYDLFDKMYDANPVSWNVIIRVCAIHSYNKDASWEHNLMDYKDHWIYNNGLYE